MQLFALEDQKLIAASVAEKGKNYQCPECLGSLRVKGGDQRQSHFFHLRANPTCRQHQKGPIHLRLQHFVKYLFEDAEMEKSFSQIGRIADVACLSVKKIFEIQYSPISLEEAQARCQDYESLGFQVIWILHDHTFNKKRVSASESFLRSKA